MTEMPHAKTDVPCQVPLLLPMSIFDYLSPYLGARILPRLKGVKDAKNEKKVPILEFLTVRDNFRKTLSFSSDFWGSIVPAQIFGWKITKIQLQTAPPVGQVMNFNSLGGLGLQTNWFHRKCLEEDLRISASRKEEKICQIRQI